MKQSGWKEKKIVHVHSELLASLIIHISSVFKCVVTRQRAIQSISVGYVVILKKNTECNRYGRLFLEFII